MKTLLVLIILAFASQSMAQGLLQNEDFKTESELIDAGGTKANLLNSNKIYMNGLDKTLFKAVQDGNLGSNLSNKGEIQTHDGTNPAALPVGNDGQTLVADPLEATGLKWIDFPVAVSVDSKGDIQTHDGTDPATLPVGSDGQLLSADSAEGTGLKWINPPISTVFKNQTGTGLELDEVMVPDNQLTLVDSGKALIETGNNNLLENPSFQHQTTATGWTVTGVAASDETSDIDGSAKAIKFVTSGDTGSLRQDSTLNINSLADGAYGSLRVRAKNSANGSQVCFRQAGNNSICKPLLTDNKWRTYHFPSVLLGGTSNGVGFEWDNSTGTTIIGNAVLQLDNPVVQVAQAEHLGRVSFSDNDCEWSRSSTNYGIPLSATSNCTATVSNPERLAYDKTNQPTVKIKNARAGATYKVSFQGLLFNGADSNVCYFSLSSGSSYENKGEVYVTTISGGLRGSNHIIASFEFATSGDKEISVITRNNAGAKCDVYGITSIQSAFDVTYYPPPTEVIASRCENPIDCETVFSAKVSSTGVVSDENLDWINGNASITDTSQYTLTLNNLNLTGVLNCSVIQQFTNREVSFQIGSSTSSTIVFRTRDSSGLSNVTSGFSIICQRTGDDYKKAKINYQLAQLKASNVDGGVDFGLGRKMKTCQYAFGGAGSLTAPTNCTSSPCTEYFDSCNAGTPPTIAGTGIYASIVFDAGTWANNSFITCECNAFTSESSGGCVGWNTATDRNTTSSTGGYDFYISTVNREGTLVSGFANITCTAEAP